MNPQQRLPYYGHGHGHVSSLITPANGSEQSGKHVRELDGIFVKIQVNSAQPIAMPRDLALPPAAGAYRYDFSLEREVLKKARQL